MSQAVNIRRRGLWKEVLVGKASGETKVGTTIIGFESGIPAGCSGPNHFESWAYRVNWLAYLIFALGARN